jgi:hypothetical protein
MAREEGVCKKLAENAHKKVVEHFSSDAMCSRYLGAYREIIQQRGKTANSNGRG